MANRGELELTLHEISQLKNLMSSLRKEHDESEFRIGAPFNSFHMGPPVPCTAGIDKATIRADGDVFPCVSMKGLIKKSNGNSLWDHSLQSIWSEAELFQWIRAYMSMVLSENSCSRCNDSSGCGGGCLTQRLIEGLPKMIDTYCLEDFPEALASNMAGCHEAAPASTEGWGYEADNSR
jgi:radical SAM protein with 4Fe4S-binding SPASM domain